MTEDRWEDWKEERDGYTLEERQEQAAATLLRQMAVSRLRAGADPEVLLRQIRDAARLADDGEDPAMASYLRAVAMVLNGEEPEDVPAVYRDHVEAVRKAVWEKA